MRPGYCPIGKEPCQSMCETPCSTQPRRKPLALDEIKVIENKIYRQTTHKGKPLFEYAQALIRAVEVKHGIKD